MNENGDGTEGEIIDRTVKELARTLDSVPDGSYAFLIGAGASRPEPAEIPTADELIAKFKEELYQRDAPHRKDKADWAGEYEKEHRADWQNEYGFWFSKRHPTPAARKDEIREIVEYEDLPFGQIILANMMDDGIVSHTFTPNFDDLLFDAFHEFSKQRPMFVDHQAKAPDLALSDDRPAIVKLHGDYIHDTQNTTEETDKLNPELRDLFEQALNEYGFVVVGYGGTDDSIMDVLENTSFTQHGLFWCQYGDLEDRVENLLRESENAYRVHIDGADELFGALWRESESVELPQSEEIMNRAEQRRDMIQRRKDEFADTTQSDSNGEKEEQTVIESKLWDINDKLTEGEYESAIEIANQVLELDHKNSTAYVLRGIAKRNLERYEEAIEDSTQAIDLDPKNTAAYHSRGIAKRKLEQYEEAIEDYSEAIDLDPKNAVAYYNRGSAKGALELYKEAIEDYSEAIDLDPEDAEAYHNRGNAKSELERYEEAIEDYSEAINLDPEYASAYFNRGWVEVELERYEEAIEDYSEAIELAPEDASAYFNRGNAKAELERYEEAIEDYSEAINLDPEDAAAYVNRGNAKRDLERYEEAIEDYSEAINLAPEDAAAYHGRGNAKAELERYEEAIEDYSEAIDLDRKNAVVYYGRGASKAELERYEEAIEDYSEAINLDPEYAPAYHGRGWAEAELERYEEAIEDYSEAINLNPEYAPAYNNRGIAKGKLERYEEAIEDYSEAFDLDPEYLAAIKNKAEVHIILNEFDQARETARKARAESDSVSDRAEAILLEIIAAIALGNETDKHEDKYLDLCDKMFATTWNFRELDSWIEEADLDENKRERIEDLIELLREHKEN
jgi:tetratricopeptide (TPR) repeat protein